MTGPISAISKTAARSAIIGAAVMLSVISASETFAQGITIPDTTVADPAIAQVDTAREVTHTVKKGDTLWDLAQYYLKDPFRWPEIFRRNTDVVENPHWIYPGEIIRIWGDQVRPDAFARADSTGNVVSHVITQPVLPPPPQGPVSDLTVFASPLSRAAAEMGSQVIGRTGTPGVRRGEVEAAPYIDRNGGPPGVGRLTASVDRLGIQAVSTETRFQLNDRIYFEPPRGFVARIGDRYLSYVLGDEIPGVGQVIVPTGIVRIEIVTPGQPSQVRIVRMFGEIRLQQGLIPFFDVVLPSTGTSPIAGGPAGKVLYLHNHPVLPSIGHYVVISPSSRQGVKVGDEFTFVDESTGRRDENAAPPVSAGRAQAVRVTPYGTTAIIVGQTQPTIREGMGVQLTGKMP